MAWASTREHIDMAVRQARDRMVQEWEAEEKRRRDAAGAARSAFATRRAEERVNAAESAETARARAAEAARKAVELEATKAAKRKAKAEKEQAKLEAQAKAKVEAAERARAEAVSLAAARRKEADRMQSGPTLLFDPNAAIAAAEGEWLAAVSEAAVVEAAMAQAALAAASSEHELAESRDRKQCGEAKLRRLDEDAARDRATVAATEAAMHGAEEEEAAASVRAEEAAAAEAELARELHELEMEMRQVVEDERLEAELMREAELAAIEDKIKRIEAAERRSKAQRAEKWARERDGGARLDERLQVATQRERVAAREMEAKAARRRIRAWYPWLKDP